MVKLLVNAPERFLRPNNTDWRYAKSLSDLSLYGAIDVRMNDSFAFECYANALQLINGVRARIPIARLIHLSGGVYDYPIAFQAESVVDVLYSNYIYPNSSRLPTVWFYGVVDPEMRIARGESVSSIELEYEVLERYFERTAKIIMPTKCMVERHRQRYPTIADKFEYVPFFLPHLSYSSESEILKKHTDCEVVNFLFVGREWERKGLDRLFLALESLSDNDVDKIFVTVVTSKDFKPTLSRKLSSNVNILHEVSRSEVLRLMMGWHCFIMPSRFETYGFVYLEAQAAGCAVIGADWESQRELFDSGNAGINLSISADAAQIAKAIESCLDFSYRKELAINGYRRAAEKTASVSAHMHIDVFARSAGRV